MNTILLILLIACVLIFMKISKKYKKNKLHFQNEINILTNGYIELYNLVDKYKNNEIEKDDLLDEFKERFPKID